MSKRPNLRTDERGAVMVTGLFMAFVLIGALWFVIGIGNAVIFRDRMQEAADHAAFTSAALHAKGMNFISACNIVMLVMVAVHIVLGVLHDVTLAACILSLGVGCSAWVSERKVYEGYSKMMKPALTAIHKAETVAAYGYPWLGTVKAAHMGSKYGDQGSVGPVNVLAIGTSNFPGSDLGGANIGLPVEAEPMNRLCKKVAGLVVNLGRDVAVKQLPFAEAFIDAAMMFLRYEVEFRVQERYCASQVTWGYNESLNAGRRKVREQNGKRADKTGGAGPYLDVPSGRTSTGNIGSEWKSLLDPGFDVGWDTDGPLILNLGARNGTDYFSVWAVNIKPAHRETSERRVAIAGGPRSFGSTGDARQNASLYYAQAEFYFDCEDAWKTDGCNGSGIHDFNASFAIKWRARLRRLNLPNLGALLTGFAFDKLVRSKIRPGLDAAVEKQNREAQAGKYRDTGVYAEPLSYNSIRAAKRSTLRRIEELAREGLTDLASTPTGIDGAYH